MLYRLSGCLLLLLLSACGSESQSYFPLQAGAAWHYNIDRTTMDGTTRQKYMLQSAPPRELNGELLAVKRMANGAWLYYRETDDGLYLVGHQEMDQPWPQIMADDRQLLLKYPLMDGSSWIAETDTVALFRTGPPQRSEYRITVPVSMQYRVEATNDIVRVPAGRFENCVRVHGTGIRRQYDAGNYIGRTDITIENTDWYAPGVGLVKSVRKESTAKKVMLSRDNAQLFAGGVVMELERFKKGSKKGSE